MPLFRMILLAAASVLAGTQVADAGRARPPKPTPLAAIMAAHARAGRQATKPKPRRRLLGSTRQTPMALSIDPATRVRLMTGLGKDGNPLVAYVAQHPTNYIWRPDVGRLARKVVNLPLFKGKVWINTYRDHPPGWGRDVTSFDVWGFGGRGDSLDPADGEAILEMLFNDPNKPDIDWIIYRGRMWTRATGQWGPSPPGPPDSDPEHNNHLHVTYL